jgi:hypothetical protein
MPWRVAEGIYTEEIEGETIVLDSAGNRYLTLNETASEIWSGAVAGESLRDIVARLTAGWDVSEDDAEASARRLIQKLVDAGILTTA